MCQVSAAEIETFIKLAKASHKAIELLPEQAINQKSTEDFICGICLSIVHPNIVECSNCDRLFCKTCIVDWTKRNKTCPNCRAAFIQTARLHRIAMNTLKELVFRCLKCPDDFKYSENQSHQLICKGLTYVCPLAHCGRSAMSFEDLKSHLLHDCKQVNMTCATCDSVAKREAMHRHYICTVIYQKEKA